MTKGLFYCMTKYERNIYILTYPRLVKVIDDSSHLYIDPKAQWVTNNSPLVS